MVGGSPQHEEFQYLERQEVLLKDLQPPHGSLHKGEHVILRFHITVLMEL